MMSESSQRTQEMVGFKVVNTREFLARAIDARLSFWDFIA